MSIREDIQLSNEAFWAWVNLPENASKNFELRHGEIVEMPSPTFIHGWIISQLFGRIFVYLMNHPMGDVLGDTMDYGMAEGVILRPDISFIAKGRMTFDQKYPLFAPDIAVEVVSPSNTAREMLYKVETYLQYGTQLVWVIYPEERLILVYRKGEGRDLIVNRLTDGDTLTGGNVLPNFAVPVTECFPPQATA